MSLYTAEIPHGLPRDSVWVLRSLGLTELWHGYYYYHYHHLYFYYRDKCEKSNTINEKHIQHTTVKGSLKKKKVAHKSVQTDKEEDNLKVNIADLTSDGMLQR